MNEWLGTYVKLMHKLIDSSGFLLLDVAAQITDGDRLPRTLPEVTAMAGTQQRGLTEVYWLLLGTAHVWQHDCDTKQAYMYTV